MERSLKHDDMFHLGVFPSPMSSPSPLRIDETKQRENKENHRKRKAEHGSSVDDFGLVQERRLMKRRHKGSVTKPNPTMGILLLESTNVN